jgi:phosphonate transport system substrate-binding protein
LKGLKCLNAGEDPGVESDVEYVMSTQKKSLISSFLKVKLICLDALRSAIILCLLSLPIWGPGRALADIELVFGTYAADKPTATVRKYSAFLDFLAQGMSAELNEPVTIRIKVAKTYAQGIDDLASGRVSFSRFGPASYVTVKQKNPAIQIIAMESKSGKKRFNGVIVVHKDSEHQELSDLKGLSFAFGDELSTIGRYLAQAHLLRAGISSADLSHHAYLGSHDLVGQAVGTGRFQAGALKESTYKNLVKKGVPIRALFTFENVTKPWLSHPDVPSRVTEAMRVVMLAAENEAPLRQIAKNGFLAGSDADYQLVRDAMERSQDF